MNQQQTHNITKNSNSRKFLMRRIRSWMRSPRFYAQKARERIFGIDTTFIQKGRESYSPGSFEWLALTEALYGGVQITKSHIGGDRMSLQQHGYGPCYADFLKPFIVAPAFGRLTLVEVGIFKGNGLAVWCDLFPDARVIGMDIDLSNFNENRKHLEKMGAFQKNAPEVYLFDQLDAAKATGVLRDVLRGSCIDIAIDDGCHSIQSIEITLEAMRPFLAKTFAYFIEDNFDTYDRLAHSHREYYWTTRREITIVTSR